MMKIIGETAFQEHLRPQTGLACKKNEEWRYGMEGSVEENKDKNQRITFFSFRVKLYKKEEMDLSFVTLRFKIESNGRSQFNRM